MYFPRPLLLRYVSRSTWACELKFDKSDSFINDTSHAPRERVSWNAYGEGSTYPYKGHAPRERVSWNENIYNFYICRNGHAPRERVSWNFKGILKINDDVSHAPRERVSWNGQSIPPILENLRHAPRERVSWNLSRFVNTAEVYVTLHVSVWVEMTGIIGTIFDRESRSTWACELKFVTICKYCWGLSVTLHVSVWVEIFKVATF